MLLDNLPETDGPEHIVDLGCGNGVLGTVAALDNPQAEVTFVDDSALAIDAATVDLRRHASAATARPASCGATASRTGRPATPQSGTGPGSHHGSVGLVLTNPPFHEQRARGDAVAWQMFGDARAALRPGGELWAVGNRHLGHHAKLTRLFGNCEVVASSPKFVVLRAVRR